MSIRSIKTTTKWKIQIEGGKFVKKYQDNLMVLNFFLTLTHKETFLSTLPSLVDMDLSGPHVLDHIRLICHLLMAENFLYMHIIEPIVYMRPSHFARKPDQK